MPPEAPAFWAHRGAASALLLPASAAYDIARRINKARTKTPVRAGVPVICIGNLVVGGAGKTPAALFVGEMIKQLGVAPFFLSRGYGGKITGPVLVDPDRHNAREVGDEPLLLAAAASTVVAADRVKGAKFAVAQGAQALVMDDGFQNDSLHKDFSLLVVDANYGFGNERLLPAGPLREPVAEGLRRADAVLVMDGNFELEKKMLLHGRLNPEGDTARWQGKKVLAFAGIGRPEKFRATLEQIGAEIAEFVPFADHHRYRDAELKAMQYKAEKIGAALITTAKDAVRLPPMWRSKIAVLEVHLHITEAEQLRVALERGLQHAA